MTVAKNTDLVYLKISRVMHARVALEGSMTACILGTRLYDKSSRLVSRGCVYIDAGGVASCSHLAV